MRATRTLVLVVLIGAAALLGSACAKTYQAESDGQDVGEAICDVHDADSPEEAQDALTSLESDLDELSGAFSSFTSEDRADISENLSDLAQHVSDGDQALAQQDIAVIQRSLSNIRDDLGRTGQAAVDGVQEGLMECESS